MKKIKKFLSGFKKGMRDFGTNISVIVNTVLLTIVYFFGVGLTFLITKILRKQFFDNKINKDAETYWKDLNLGKEKINAYYRQF